MLRVRCAGSEVAAARAQWTGCIAGALAQEEFRDGLSAAGFTDIEVRLTHEVRDFASSAVIRARKPRGMVT